MNKKLKRILKVILLLPILPIIGIPGEGAGAAGAEGSAAGDAGTGTEGTEGTGSAGEGNGTGDQTSTGESGAGKTFTQAEVNAMMAKEKNQGRAAALKELGIADVKTGKASLAAYQAYVESQKTEAQKATDTATAAETARIAAENRAQTLEYKFEVVASGVKAESAEDVVELAKLRMSDTKDFKTALAEIKTAYPSFFGDGSNNAGTGGNPNGRGNADNMVKGVGARLGTSANKAPAKSSYFSK